MDCRGNRRMAGRLRQQPVALPLDLASHAVVANLLGQVGDGLLQAHVESQPLAEVVPHLQEQCHFASHA